MRPTLSLILFVSLLLTVRLQAALEDLRHAQSLLGSETWSRLIKVDNQNPSLTYPGSTYALVFEFNGILWFYAPRNGTQSLSLYAGRAGRDKADLLPLLREIEPGFVRFREIKDQPYLPESTRVLPNGCFLESMAAARVRAARGDRIEEGAILLYYADRGGRLHGHAVFAYKTPDGVFVDDSARTRPARIGSEWHWTPLVLARSYEPDLGNSLVTARLVPVKGTVATSLASSATGAEASQRAIEAARSM